MPDSSTYLFYEAYVKNVRDFLLAEKEIKRTINRALKTKKDHTVEVQSKVYALLYSTFSEASFMKMIFTPYGFEQAFVDEILRQETIQEKWFKCIELAFNNFNKHTKGSEIPNKSQDLKRIINDYIVDPSFLRNKIAHGQLTVAMNRKNTNLNLDVSAKLQNLDYVTIYRWFRINEMLCSIIEDLIESPDNAHYNYYYTKYQRLEDFIYKSSTWTTKTKLRTRSMSRLIPHLNK